MGIASGLLVCLSLGNAIVSSLAASDGCAADNLLINCSFENNPVTFGTFGAFSDSLVDGWNSKNVSTIEFLGNGFEGITSFDGENILELDAGHKHDGVYQDVTTGNGEEYVLSFYIRARKLAKWNQQTERVYVEWNGVLTKVDGYTPASTADWTRYEVVVVGTGGSDRLLLRESTVDGANDKDGALVDLVQLQPKNTVGGGGGDPHFKTWSGHRFDYHGACDLVLVDQPNFDNGKGLIVHVRTTKRRYFSYIEQSVLRIGDDVLEYRGQHDSWVL